MAGGEKEGKSAKAQHRRGWERLVSFPFFLAGVRPWLWQVKRLQPRLQDERSGMGLVVSVSMKRWCRG